MITIVGKKFFVILLTFTSFTFPLTIQLKLATLDGAPLQQAAVGQPFLLNVVVTNANDMAQYPVLKGIDNFHVRQSGFQMNMINGNTAITYHYRVRIDTAGTYTLGPAQLTHENTTVESEPITVTVGQEQKSSGTTARNSKNAAATPILKLTCEPTSAFVGEKIVAQLSFYTSDPTTTLQTIGEPELTNNSGFTVKNKQTQPTTGIEKINGTEYRFAKWNFEIYPTKPGSVTVPAYSADYVSSSGQPMLSFFFRNEVKRIFSNTVTLDLKPLPHSYKTPAFIGSIDALTARINPAHARVGEGMVLALSISGTGDFDRLGMLPLTMPDQLKWYESKKYANADGYTMEYIVQAVQPGTITIPQQDLYYFDTRVKQYKTISTTPLSIEITGTAAPEVSAVPLPNDDVINSKDPLAPLNQNGPIQNSPTKMIPWPIFWSVLAIILFLWMAYILLNTGKNALRKIFTHIVQKRYSIYYIADKRIRKAYLYKKYTDYYFYINELFARRLHITQAQLTPEIIENSLRQDGLSEKAVQDWRNFYAEITQMSFYKQDLDEQYYLEITKKAHYWIDVLEQLPRVHL